MRGICSEHRATGLSGSVYEKGEVKDDSKTYQPHLVFIPGRLYYQPYFKDEDVEAYRNINFMWSS